jgi:pimeloyl-ACP methyl ester carboxylesterase
MQLPFLRRNIMSTQRIAGPSGRIHIDDGGRGGIPVVFIHSFAGNTTHWSSQLMHLRPSRRAIAFDLRGHGNSEPATDNDYSIQSLCGDLSAVINALNLRKFVLVGHSLGGSVAIAYAGQHSQNLEGLVLVEAPGNIPSGEAEQILSWLESDYGNVIRTYWDRLLSRAQPHVSSQIRAEMARFDRQAVMAIVRATLDFDPVPPLTAYDGPRLAVITSHNESPHDLHRVVPDLPYRTLPGTSHWVHMDRPVDFNVLLDEFLGTLELSSTTQQHTLNETRVHQLLERFSAALSAQNVQDFAACWETPAVFLSDEGARVFRDKAQIEQMFGKAGDAWRSQGITSARPEIERTERLSETLAEVDVRWTAVDAAGNEKWSEHTHYIIHYGKDGEPRIQVALSSSGGRLAA